MVKASFVIPSYNAAAWLAHAIDSAQKQTYPNLEIVVVDDASTDSTPELLAYLSERDRRIKVFRNETNLGRSASRNLGNEKATGDILLVLDADDIAYPDRAKLSVEKLKKVQFTYGSMDVMDCIGTKTGMNYADVFDKQRAIRTKLNFITHSSVAYTKEVALKFPYKDGHFSSLGIDDWAQQVDCASGGVPMDFIPQMVGAYRELSTGISKTRDGAKVDEVKTAYLESLKVAA